MPPAQQIQQPLPPLSPVRLFLASAVMVAASLMQVLDSTIANVALPHMQASLGATQEAIAWVLTSYIVASGIAIPLTGWLEGRIGRRALFMVAIGGFTISSAACGLAPTLPAMVAARIAQGVFGAFIGPISQSSLLDTFPREKQPMAMTIWGMAVMVGPIIGPAVGAYLTDRFDWRWVFFINVPIGIVVTIGAWFLLRPAQTPNRKFDLGGFAMLALALGSLQLLLDRGTQLDWFDSTEIWIETGVALAGFWMFAIHSITSRDSLIPLGVLRDRNLMLASLFMCVASGSSMAGAVLVTPMLQRLLGYDVMHAGLLAMPRGAATMLSMLVTNRLLKYFDTRVVIAFGLLLVAISQWHMTGFDLQMGSGPVIVSGVVQGFGFGLLIMPMNLMAFATLAPMFRTEGASLYNLSRNVGGSVAISITGTLLARSVQVSHSDLTSHVTALSLPLINGGIVERFGMHGADIAWMVDAEVNRQALMIAYLNDYYILAIAAVVLIPITIFLRRAKEGAEPPPPISE